MQDLHDLGLMLDRNTPLLLIESHEEARVLELLTRIAVKRGLALQQWTVSDGLRRLGFGEEVSGDRDVSAGGCVKTYQGPGSGRLVCIV